MKCFRHPTDEAAVFCKGCGKALCLECGRKLFGNETHVCSEECAQIASKRAALEGEEPRESAFDKIYAAVFLTVLLALLGGGSCVWGAKSAINAKEQYARGKIRDKKGISDNANIFRIFYTFGITDWRAQFGIGASVGVVSAVTFLRNYRKAGK